MQLWWKHLQHTSYKTNWLKRHSNNLCCIFLQRKLVRWQPVWLSWPCPTSVTTVLSIPGCCWTAWWGGSWVGCQFGCWPCPGPVWRLACRPCLLPNCPTLGRSHLESVVYPWDLSPPGSRPRSASPHEAAAWFWVDQCKSIPKSDQHGEFMRPEKVGCSRHVQFIFLNSWSGKD